MLVTFKRIMIKWTGYMWFPGANMEGYHAQKRIKTKRKKGQQHSGLSVLWLLFSCLECEDACSFHLVLASKEGGQKPPNSHTVQAGTLRRELSSRTMHMPPFSQHPTDKLASGTAGHITICTPENEPLPCCFLFSQGFQGSSLSSLKQKV